MELDLSHKTVFVLDHSNYFSKASGIVIDYDLSSKNRAPGIIPLPPLKKKLWTCSAESVLEYCRMIYDVRPIGKHICLIASDAGATVLNSWIKTDQTLLTLSEALAKLDPPKEKSTDCDIMYGLMAALSALTRCTEEQHQARTSLDGNNTDQIVNRGRIICITNLTRALDAEHIVSKFKAALVEENKIAASSDQLIPIHNLDLELIDIHPSASPPVIQAPVVTQFEGLTCEVGSYKVGKMLTGKIINMIQKHFELTITTITGIPMKEEQNAGTSANYDVGILHSKKAHDEILCLQKMNAAAEMASSSLTNANAVPSPAQTFEKISNVVLKWCQPRLSISDLLHCTASFRISPVDVNSRPSLCLTNFLLNGRQVILEQPRRTGAKVVTHMLASHGGEIFIHCLGMNRSPLEDPPSISEGPGGRVTDYRIKDFGAFMRRNRLAPCQDMAPFQDLLSTQDIPEIEDDLVPIERAKAQLERMTQTYPMIISETVLYNLHMCINPLLDIIYKPVLDVEDVTECRNIIYGLVKMEASSEPLPVPTMGTVRKGNKRDEQYRQMWNELEALTRSSSYLSPSHMEVLQCVLGCRKPNPGEHHRKDRPTSERLSVKTDNQDKEQVSKRVQELVSPEPVAVDLFSPESPPPSKKPNLDFTGTFGKPTGGGQNLLSLWSNRLTNIHSRKHSEFAGRAESFGAIATLYANLKSDATKGSGGNGNKISNKTS